MNKKFWAAAFTLSGTIIGAGILGLPYVFAQTGFFIGIFWLFFLGSLMLMVNLSLGEVSLRTKDTHHIPGLAEKYLGKTARKVMLFAIVFGIYSALLAYLIGEGQSLSKLFFGSFEYSFYFAIGFWACMTLLLRDGLKGLKRVEVYGVLFIIGIVFLMLIWFFPQVDFNNLNNYDFSNFFIPIGVVLFALLGFSSIPELRMEIRGQEKFLRNAIILGVVIPIIIYSVFTFVFVGVLGNNVGELATISLGNFIVLLGIFTMLTSYFVLSFVLSDVFRYDLKDTRKSFFFVSVVPLLLYVMVSFFNLGSFVAVIGIGGAVSSGLAGTLILAMNIYSKRIGQRKPEFSVPMNWVFVIFVAMIFAVGIFMEVFWRFFS